MCLRAALAAVLAASAPLAFHYSPRFVGLWTHGRMDWAPEPMSLWVLLQIRRRNSWRTGSTWFARDEVYFQEPLSYVTAKDLRAYASEGYLVFRNFLPAVTVEAIREDVLASQISGGRPSYELNAWLGSDSMLDFFTFGPCSRLAAEMLGGEAHLLFSYHHFRDPRSMQPFVKSMHFDRFECESTTYPLPGDVVKAHLKFYIPLYDSMPAMWFVNHSSMEASVRKVMPELVPRFQKGQAPWAEIKEVIDGEELEELAVKPLLSLGDAIIHSPCILHRSPAGIWGKPVGFLGPTYASPRAQFKGFNDYRQCDSGIPPLLPEQLVPTVARAPRPGCFPRVYPRPSRATPLGGRVPVAYRGTWSAPWEWYKSALKRDWEQAREGRFQPSLGAPLITDVPPSQRVVLAPGGMWD